MAQFLEVNIPHSVDQDRMNKPTRNMCFCCLALNETLINIANCEHSDFLQEYYTMGDSNVLVCQICHSILKKITLFKKQVAECSRIMNLKLQVLHKTNKLMNLQQSNITITSNDSKVEDMEFEIKVEMERGDSRFELEEKSEVINENQPVKIKIKLENSDIENNALLPEINRENILKKPKKLQAIKLDEKYSGKIGTLVMNTEELMEERERESRKDSYLKLPFKCVSCIKGFKFKTTLKNHNKMLHNERKGNIVCDICKSVIASGHGYRKHTMRHLKRFVCLVCGKRATEIYTLTHHFNQQHGDTCGGITTLFECDLCSFSTDSHRARRYHREKHKKSQCGICGYNFANSSSLKVHVDNIHKGITCQYTCPTCQKCYKTRSGLVKHSAIHEPKENNGAYCGKCGTHYANRTNLAQHLRTHSAHVTDESKRYTCQDCDAKFVTKSALETHSDWSHRKIYRFQCNQCSKAFKTAHNLKRHGEYVHSKKIAPKNKVCDYCGKAFSSTNVLVTHIRTHTGERPFHCTHCAATFAHAASLYNHKKLLHKNKIH